MRPPYPQKPLAINRRRDASILLAAGRGLQALQRRLGHKSITVSSDLYGHVIESAAREDAEATTALVPARAAAPETPRSGALSQQLASHGWIIRGRYIWQPPHDLTWALGYFHRDHLIDRALPGEY